MRRADRLFWIARILQRRKLTTAMQLAGRDGGGRDETFPEDETRGLDAFFSSLAARTRAERGA